MPPVEIQWCDHSSVLLEYLRQLYEEGRFVDVGLECEGRQVKAHKAVISACSPYLEGLLKGNPARSHLIKFNGYSYNSLRAVIDFMYNGKVMVEQEHLAAFLKLGRALQVRGILDIAAQCEEAGLTTAEETKSNAQYSTTVQQPPKTVAQAAPKMVQQTPTTAETKKYAFLLDKGSTNTAKKPGPQFRKVMPNIIGTVDQQGNINKVTSIGAAQVAQQQQQQQPQQQQQQQTVQQTQAQQTVQQVVQQQPQQVQSQQAQPEETVTEEQQPQQQQAQEAAPTTLEELQQALASGQAILQTTDNGSEQTLQMVEGQCVVTGSGQTYVVVQEGDNISFVPAEMVQGDLGAAVNGGQVVEGLDPVEQQLAQMEGQVLTHNQVIEGSEQQPQEAGGGHEATTGAGVGDSGSLDTMSVVESLVKLGEKQPADNENGSGEETPEVGADMPSLEGDAADDGPEVGADMPCLGDVEEDDGGVGTVPTERVDGEGEGEEELDESGDGTTGEDTGKRRRQPSQKMIEAMGMLKRRVSESPTQGGRGKKLKN
ncbi:longitudinals lacking protein, isoforms H/M/V-like isoform X3 [Penaeus japonicus]|uniref:longitudinals lacking protein, isoforms H/M/V-like isoform X3 n=1 Tax=Penaeus japonicus TaxID=27405 RepID=UPI001C7100B5|nr:longitudinals lacking protein, isoforms H/M/V-like isoform X3 [Penaeus japonicus]